MCRATVTFSNLFNHLLLLMEITARICWFSEGWFGSDFHTQLQADRCDFSNRHLDVWLAALELVYHLNWFGWDLLKAFSVSLGSLEPVSNLCLDILYSVAFYLWCFEQVRSIEIWACLLLPILGFTVADLGVCKNVIHLRAIKIRQRLYSSFSFASSAIAFVFARRGQCWHLSIILHLLNWYSSRWKYSASWQASCSLMAADPWVVISQDQSHSLSYCLLD